MHTREEGSSDEGDLVHYEEDDRAPLLLEAPGGVGFELCLLGASARDTEAGAAGLGSEANVESSDARVSRDFDGGVDVLLLKQETNMLDDGLECRRLATARRAT